jgi:hypothetical protein
VALERIRLHDLRHTAVSRMIEAKIPLPMIGKIVGWSPSTLALMIARYGHFSLEEMRAAVEMISGNNALHPESLDGNQAVGQNSDQLRRVPVGEARPIATSGSHPVLIAKYDRNELYEKVWEKPLKRVAEEYGVSDVAIGKACRKLMIPLPGRGYWAKKAANQPVEPRPPLATCLKFPTHILGSQR